MNKAERYEQELLIFQLRHESGLQLLRGWAYARRDHINERWPSLSGDELLQVQGEAQLVARLIKLIDQGPTRGEA